MVNIQDKTNLSETGTAIGETCIAWIPDVIEDVVNELESQEGIGHLINTLPQQLQSFLIDDVTLSYSQFRQYKEDKNILYQQSKTLIYDNLRTYLRRYSDDYNGYLTYLQENTKEHTRFFFRRFTARLPLSQVHTYIVGGSGSGKSELMKQMIYDRYKRAKSAVIVLDPKGDLARQLVNWKEHADDPERLIDFNPYLFQDRTPVLNPLEIKDRRPKNIQVAAYEIRETFDMILSDIEGGFTPRMKNILGHTLSVVMHQGGSLADLKRFFNNDTNADLIKAGLESPDEQTRLFFKHEFDKLNSDTINGILGRLGLLLQNKTFRDLTTGESTIKLGQAIRDKKMIVINLAKGAITREYSRFFGKLVVSLVLIEAMKNANNIEDEKLRPQIDLFIDEFQNYITPAVGEIAAEARAYGVRLYMATQLIGQDMSKSLEQLILTNTDTKAIGWSSIENRSAMAKQFGMTATDLEIPKRTFWARIANGAPFKVQTSGFLVGNSNAMSKADREKVLNYQKRYYKRLDKQTKSTTTPPPPKNEPFDNSGQTVKPKFDL